MPNRTLHIPADPAFWPQLADALIAHAQEVLPTGSGPLDLSGLRVLMPGPAHGRLLQRALVARLGPALIPPRIGTLAAWLELLPPDSSRPQPGGSERLMTLYAQLRENAWLKKLFSARRNTDLLPLARDWSPDLLVHEAAELASPLVGAVLDVPSVTHSFGGAVPAAVLAEAGDLLSELWTGHGVEPRPYAGSFTCAYLDICPTSVQTQPLDHIAARQPLRPVPYTGEAAGALPAIVQDTDRTPLVYLTLGTVQNHGPVLSAAVHGLAGLDARVLVAVGPDGDTAALGRQPAHVSVQRWVCQSEVLPRCAVVVSHAGSGTFLGALAHGLPQLCLPQAADQFRNSHAAVETGAGLKLHPDQATPTAVADAVRRLLTEESFRRAALVLAGEIQAMPAPAEVVRLLERLV